VPCLNPARDLTALNADLGGRPGDSKSRSVPLRPSGLERWVDDPPRRRDGHDWENADA